MTTPNPPLMYSQQNIEELFALIGTFPSQQQTNGKYFDLVKTTKSIWPNQLYNLRVPLEQVDELFDAIAKADASTLPKLLMCNPTTDDQHVLNALREKQYRSSTWTAMSHNLLDVPLLPQLAKLNILLVSKEDQMRHWLAVVEAELMGGQLLNEEIFLALLNSRKCSFFLGVINGQAVATAFLFKSSNDHGGIYLVATSNTHRNQGIGSQMTQACLQKARFEGCSEVHIQATEDGKNMYESLGFVSQGPIHVFSIGKKRDFV